ncbi:hypothetical protein Tco_0530697 [Tanacetum coccineum]
MEKNKLYDKDEYKKKLYDALVESYNTDKDLFDSYGEVFSLKRSRDEKDKDRDPSTGSDRGTKRRKSSKDAESSRDSRSKEKKSSSTSKDASQSQHTSSSKSAHSKEQSHTVEDLGMQQDKEFIMGNNDEQPTDKEVTKADWFKEPERPLTLDLDWSKRQQVDFRPPQTWISQVARAEEPPTSFDELNDTSFDFSTFVINRLKIPNLTQEILVGPAFNLLKGTCKSITELEYHFEECSKATTKCLNWHNPENKPYPFNLRKPLPLIQDHRGRQIIPQIYFINKGLEYLKGGDLSRRYSNSVTKTKAATYNLKWIEDLGPKCQRFYGFAANMSSSKDVYFRKRIIAVTRLSIMKMCDYHHLEEIEVRREDQKLYKFREGDFLRLLLQDIKDMLRLLVQKKLTNLTIDERYDLNVALRYRQTALSEEVDAESEEVHCQNQRDLPKDIPLDSVEVLMYEKRSKSENKGKVLTEIELVLEQTQQGTSYEVLVSAEGVEELKRKLKIKGEKKEALLHFGKNWVNTSAVKNHKDDC